MINRPSTYLDHAIASANLEAQGRFAKQTESKVTGLATYPRQPSNSPWHSDPVPPEEPLGQDLNSLAELGGASPALPAVESASAWEGSSSATDGPSPLSQRRRRRV